MYLIDLGILELDVLGGDEVSVSLSFLKRMFECNSIALQLQSRFLSAMSSANAL